MTLLEVLRRARELYLAGKHRLCGLLCHVDLVMDAAGGDVVLACRALDFLDQVAGGDGEFSRFIDGGEDIVEGDFVSHVYRHDMPEPEVAAMFGKAAVLAQTMESDA